MTTPSLENAALLKLLSSTDILNTHGLDVINQFDNDFITKNIQTIIRTPEVKSELYYLVLNYKGKCLVVKYVPGQRVRDITMDLIKFSFKHCWAPETFKSIQQCFFGLKYQPPNKSKVQDLIDALDMLSLPQFLKQLSGLFISLNTNNEYYLGIRLYDNQTSVDSYINSRCDDVRIRIKTVDQVNIKPARLLLRRKQSY